MFENLTIRLLNESHEESGGELACLPLCRSLLDAFEALGIQAAPLVIRGVVFGKVEDPNIYKHPQFGRLIMSAFNGPSANGWMEVGGTVNGEKKNIRLHYRTIGLPNGGDADDKILGSYDVNDGRWLGHVAVVANGTLIDPSIGQLNDPKFQILFDPPAITAEVSNEFLTGKKPLVFLSDGMLVAYFAYPDERTYETSRSWTHSEFRPQLKAIGERTAAPFLDRPESELHADCE